MTRRFLLSAPPDHLRIGGRGIPVNTGFRAGILARALWQDPRLQGKLPLAWKLTFSVLFAPEDAAACMRDALFSDAAAAVSWYLNDGAPVREPSAGTAAARHDAVTWIADEAMIYASFLHGYHMDLREEAQDAMHLWTFDALLAALPDDSLFMRTLLLRTTDLSSIVDDEARAVCAARQVLCRARDPQQLLSQRAHYSITQHEAVNR